MCFCSQSVIRPSSNDRLGFDANPCPMGDDNRNADALGRNGQTAFCYLSLNLEGVIPVCLLKKRVKADCSLKPR